MGKQRIPGTEEAWDGRMLGSDEAFVEVADKMLSDAVNEAAGTQLISLRMSKVMIDELKAIATRNGGLGYQTLMKQVLQRFIDGEKALLWNEYVSQKLREQHKASGENDAPRPRSRERKVA